MFCGGTDHGDSLRQYVDACKIVKGLESKFGYFVTEAAEAPQVEQVAVAAEEIKPEKAKKDPVFVWKNWGEDGWSN